MTNRIIMFVLIGILTSSVSIRQPTAVALNPGTGSDLQAQPILEHVGMCDASTAVAVGTGRFLVASDKDNKLRVYRADQSGKAVQTIDITDFMKLEKRNKEADIEASAVLGGKTFFITSLGRNKDGKFKLNRQQFFAVEVQEQNGAVALKPFGTAYTQLLRDLLRAEKLKGLISEDPDRPVQQELAPQEKGALNIEGLTAWKGTQLLIAFRNPIPAGLALLVPLENPVEVVTQGKPAKFGPPVQLDLGGRGIRSIEYWAQKQAYLIVAGSYQETGAFGLYHWSGEPVDPPKLLRQADLTGLNPEAIVVYPEGNRFQLLSDDGAGRSRTMARVKTWPTATSERSLEVCGSTGPCNDVLCPRAANG